MATTKQLTSYQCAQSLWQKAADNLDDNLKVGLDFKHDTKQSILTALTKIAEEKKQLCIKKRWKFKNIVNGKEIIVRDVIEKIIVCIDKFKAIGDVIVQYDPGHASIPWGCVRFLLQVVVNDKQVFGAIIEGLETVSHLITRYAIFENLYIRPNASARGELEAMLIILYTDVLIYLAKARKYFQTATAIRISKSVFQSNEDKQMQKIVAQDAKVSDLATLSRSEIQQNTKCEVIAIRTLLEGLEAPINRLVDQAAVYAKTLEQDRYLEILRWLSSVPYVRHHEELSENRLLGSGKWLLGHPEFVRWKRSSHSSILHLTGTAGSGKTFLSSVVVDSFLQAGTSQQALAPIAYFYCSKNPSEPARSTSSEIIRSIVRQLACTSQSQRNVHDALVNDYERREAQAKIDGFDIPRLGITECIKLILDMTGSNPATILIDAFDEVQEQRKDELVNALKRIVDESGSVVKVFITSRDDVHISTLLSDGFKTRIDKDHNCTDVGDFVRHQIEHCKLLNGNIPGDLKEELMKALVEGAGEMFLWAKMQIGRLSTMTHEIDLRRALQKLSENTLTQLYTENFDRVSTAAPFSRSIAMLAFQLLLCMQETLSLEAFLNAVQIADPKYQGKLTVLDLLNVCMNMVVIDSKMHVFRFTHTSVQEFLETQPELTMEHAHRSAAGCCLDMYMQGPTISTKDLLYPTKNFYHYSILYWAEHCKAVAIINANDELFQKIKDFVFDDEEISLSFKGWLDDIEAHLQVLADYHPLKKNLVAVYNHDKTPLFAACVFGFTHLLDYIISVKNFDWNHRNALGAPALYLACSAGNVEIANLFIANKADVNAGGGRYGCPLYAACVGGHVSIVQTLLNHGADPKLQVEKFDNAVQAAFLGDNEIIALVILESGFNIGTQDEYDRILQQAAVAGSTEVVRFLQKNHASSFGISGSTVCTAIETAISKGRQGVLERFLLQSQNPKQNLPSHAVSIAAIGGHNPMVIFLLEKDLDIEQEGPFGTPLRVASIMGHESTVRLLLERGANVNAHGSLGGALQAAAMKGHESIIRVLLHNQAEVNGTGGYYGSSLQAAAYCGRKKAVEILLDAGANTFQGGLFKNAFTAAADGGHGDIIHLFIEKGFVYDLGVYGSRISHSSIITSTKYRNLLRDASPSRTPRSKQYPSYQPESPKWRAGASASSFRYILSSTTKVEETRDREAIEPYSKQKSDREWIGTYALEAAASKGHKSVVKIILDHWHSLKVPFTEANNALKEASRHGHGDVVRMLLDSNIDMVSCFEDAIKCAASHGHTVIVDILLAYKENKMDISKKERTILVASSSGGHLPIIKRTLETLNQRLAPSVELAALYVEALHEAAKCNQDNAMKYLLESCPPLEMKSLLDTYTMACGLGNERAVRCLIRNTTFNFSQPELLNMRFQKAVVNGHTELVCLFLEYYDRQISHSTYREAFTIASGHGFVEIVRMIVRATKESLLSSNTLDQALNIACWNGHKEVTETLIHEGANVNAIVYEVLTQRCRTFSSTNEGADSDSRKQPRSALQAALSGFAIRSNECSDRVPMVSLCGNWRKADSAEHEQTIILLLKRGANVNEFTGNVSCPFRAALEFCSEGVIRLFIEKGAIPDKLTPDNHALLETVASRECGSASLLKLLFRAGVVVPQTTTCMNPILDLALQHFGGSTPWTLDSYRDCYSHDGRFLQSNNLIEVLENGPGAAVQLLLQHLPTEKAIDERYSLLLQMAVVAKDRRCIKLLIERQVDVNAVGFYYGSALQAAVHMGDLELTQLLLSAGADVNVLCGEHDTAIRTAVLKGHEKIVNVLIDHRADVNLLSNGEEGISQPILHLASVVGNIAVFRSLIKAGAKVNVNPVQQLQPLIAACRSGDYAIVQLLIDEGADVNFGLGNRNFPWNGELSALHMACVMGHESIARLLLLNGAEVEKDLGKLGTPLHFSARQGSVSLVSMLIEANAKVNYSNSRTALSIASTHGHLDVVQELLSAGASIFNPPHVPNALATACENGHLSIVKLFLGTLSDLDHRALVCADALPAAASQGDDMLCLLLESGTPRSLQTLTQACAKGHKGSVSILLESGLAINSNSGEGFHALYIAAYYQNLSIVQKLLDSGADVNLPSKDYGSSLQAALIGFMPNIVTSLPEALRKVVWQSFRVPIDLEIYGLCYKQHDLTNCEEIVRTLIEHGADVNADMGVFGNAIHLACFIGSKSIVELLLSKGVSMHTTSVHFETALFAALEHECAAVVQILLAGGINVNHLSTKHGTPLHYACGKRSRNIVNMLLEFGADVNIIGGPRGSILTAALSRDNATYRTCGSNGDEEKSAIIELLLNFGDKVQIRECDLIAGATDFWYGPTRERYLDIILKYDQAIQATESVLINIIERSAHVNLDALKLLLKRSGGIGVTEAMLKAVRTVPVMQVLLDHRPICHISTEIVNGAPQIGLDLRNLRQFLLDHISNTEHRELPPLPTPTSEDVIDVWSSWTGT